MSKNAKLSLRKRVSKKWESLREHHLTIMTTIFVISLGMMLFTLVFIISGTYSEWGPEQNALAWITGIVGIIIAVFLWPEFFYLRGRYNFLREYTKISSPSELRKEMAEAQEAGKILGDRYLDKLREFLLEKGIKMKRR